MTIDVRSRGWAVAPELRDYFERRVGHALRRLGPVVRGVTAYLEDMNGPRGGVDKRCRLVVRLARGGEITAAEVGAAERTVVDGAIARLGRAVRHALDRHRDRRTWAADKNPMYAFGG
ncbi:MAG TPA: HPF/RaiA family ribosome-associated protein [Gemmataceae bacterium]|jgi:putative sigma-54 modulation protein|nr:HPF/RaiA family ribosome-associated protein [Gemmataceae bacterium]